jgi:predicted RNase H-like nuclease (RuvC/YqgF family)
LKNKIQYGADTEPSQSLSKIQHLESLVFDLETSERKLQRQVAELQETEADLKDELRYSDSHGRRLNGWKNVVDREKHIELLQQVLESSIVFM